MPLRAVFFDVGETLVDETRMWGAWADALERAASVPILESLMDVLELVDQLR